MLKNLTLLVCLLVSSHHTAYSAERSDAFDDLRFVELQLSAVTTDMDLYLGWRSEEKAAMKEAARKANADLAALKMRVVAINSLKGQAPLQETTLKMIDCLHSIYQGFETKQPDVIKKEFVPCNDLDEKYTRLLKDAWKEREGTTAKTQTVPSREEELHWLERPEAQATYREAVSLIEAKHLAEAYEAFKGLEKTFDGLPAAQIIRLRLADALCMMDATQAAEKGFTDALNAGEHAVTLLTAIVESDMYSPVLYEAFYKWRTMTQMLDHGMSNSSEIPNQDYNAKRWHVIQTTKKYLADHPGDVWARTQLDRLWFLPNIQRGGSMGNDNLIHWGILYRGFGGGVQNVE